MRLWLRESKSLRPGRKNLVEFFPEECKAATVVPIKYNSRNAYTSLYQTQTHKETAHLHTYIYRPKHITWPPPILTQVYPYPSIPHRPAQTLWLSSCHTLKVSDPYCAIKFIFVPQIDSLIYSVLLCSSLSPDIVCEKRRKHSIISFYGFIPPQQRRCHHNNEEDDGFEIMQMWFWPCFNKNIYHLQQRNFTIQLCFVILLLCEIFRNLIHGCKTKVNIEVSCWREEKMYEQRLQVVSYSEQDLWPILK